jgi:site-specific recombinase XerD
LVAGGSHLQTVKEYLAHSDLKTTQRYLHPVNENMKKAVSILDNFEIKVNHVVAISHCF